MALEMRVGMTGGTNEVQAAQKFVINLPAEVTKVSAIVRPATAGMVYHDAQGVAAAAEMFPNAIISVTRRESTRPSVADNPEAQYKPAEIVYNITAIGQPPLFTPQTYDGFRGKDNSVFSERQQRTKKRDGKSDVSIQHANAHGGALAHFTGFYKGQYYEDGKARKSKK